MLSSISSKAARGHPRKGNEKRDMIDCGLYFKKRKITEPLPMFLIGLSILVIGSTFAIDIHSSSLSTIKAQKTNLRLSRWSIGIFFKENSRFPNSLDELYEYGKSYPDKIPWNLHPSEFIAGKSNSQEHSVLDGAGGLYYDSKTGELRLNLTKPLKCYWRFYLGKERNEIPADWGIHAASTPQSAVTDVNQPAVQ